MMGFVLEHRAQPFADGDRRSRRRLAFLDEPSVGELGEQGPSLAVQPVIVFSCRIQPVGQLASMAGVTCRTSMHVFRVHVPLDAREMADGFAGRESPRPRLPLEIGFAHTVDQATRARVDTIEVFEKWSNVCDFHGRLDETLNSLNASTPTRHSWSRSRSVHTAGGSARSAREIPNPPSDAPPPPTPPSTAPTRRRHFGARVSRRSC